MIKNKAFTLIELMFYLAFSSIILGMIGHAFHSVAKASTVLLKKNSEDTKLNALEQILDQAIYKNTFNQFLPSHFWHTNERLPTYIQERMADLVPSSRPLPNAAILEITETQAVIFLKSPLKPNVFIGYSETIPQITGNLKALYVPQPLDNFRIVGKPSLAHQKDNVWEIALPDIISAKADTILTNQATNSSLDPTIIIPLTDHYLLFTTNGNTLRRISLLTTENQPLLEEVSLEIKAEGTCTSKLENAKHALPRTIHCKNWGSSPLQRLYAIDL